MLSPWDFMETLSGSSIALLMQSVDRTYQVMVGSDHPTNVLFGHLILAPTIHTRQRELATDLESEHVEVNPPLNARPGNGYTASGEHHRCNGV